MEIQTRADGSMIVAGAVVQGSFLSSERAVGLVALEADGSLDRSFGNGGIVVVEDPAFLLGPRAVAFQPDGKILVGSYVRSQQGDYDFAVVRIDTGGGIDPGFGEQGTAVLGFDAGGNDRLHDLVVSDEGLILAVGGANEDGASVARSSRSLD
jgi:uncharacterized delta-60 repeat protein